MYGPSGFFADIPEDDHIVSGDLELYRDSPEGFTMLYRCQRSGRFFIYKALKPCYRGTRTYEDLLRKDFEIGFSLQHPNICQYYAFIIHPELGSCIVMEWIDGEDLGHYLSSAHTATASDRILLEICDALAYIHRKQVIHRDLKPENIMVSFNASHPKLIDFGLSDADSYARLKVAAGTQYYASPELLAGGNVDNRTDLWSLGIIMSEMGPRYRRVAGRCLKRNPGQRYPNAEDVAADIAGLGKGAGLWSKVVAASAIVFLLAAFLGRDRLTTMFNDAADYQADSLETAAGVVETTLPFRQSSPGEVSSLTTRQVVSRPARDPMSSGKPAQQTILPDNPDLELMSTDKPARASKDSRTAIDSTDLDALFRQAADELGVGD